MLVRWLEENVTGPRGALLVIVLGLGVIKLGGFACTQWNEKTVVAANPPAEAVSAEAVSSPPVPSAPAAASASAPAAASAVGAASSAFCAFDRDVVFELTPTSVSSETTTRINPFTGQPASFHAPALTPKQREAVSAILARVSPRKLDANCHLIELPDGAKVEVRGLDSSCEHGCELSGRQLKQGVAKLVFELATAASMTVDGVDQVLIPAGVTSPQAGESFARVIKGPEDLAKAVVRALGKADAYRERVRKAKGREVEE